MERDLAKDLETIEASIKDAPINALWIAYGVLPEAIKRAQAAEAEVEKMRGAMKWGFMALCAYLDGPSTAGNYDPKGAVEAMRPFVKMEG